MDALRLIKTVRHALAEARTAGDILHEAWQAGLLTEAVGARIADHDEEVSATLGQLLGEAGAHTASCLRQPPEPGLDDLPGGPVGVYPEWTGPTLVDRFGTLGELEPVLTELALLLGEMNESLVVLACGADTESLYWSCIDGLDAGSECRDLVAGLLREQRGPTGARAPDGERGERGGREGPEGPEEPEEPGGAEVVGGARREEPRLVIPLGPPVPVARGAQLRGDPSTGASCPPREAEERRSESSPARSVLIEASSSCICSSSDFEVAGAPPAAVSAVSAAGGSVQGSDMRGPLQLGGAV
ncbi:MULTISPECIES: DUF6099 family protein [Kitasatospora]|uniref:Uncharacterized protein n=1 Tax=Kitasatospora setae (strain ATCC 33774 / DSM 43861 / JCM 3304 / KCC A-0304 / NBRC 14216 / KM-6054) TaxID=452652 RepID=E4NB83_KITSK|nr:MULTISPECIES: DUF6099 family protein [Kitasatospora]BAJ28464.1 hypothetical protein KSE_26520 [Kitasatospora setae KM-6054]